MCQTTILTKKIVSASTRSFMQNVEALAGEPLQFRKLNRLNKSLDTLYTLLHNQFNDIRKEDYIRIGPQLNLLLDTIKGLYKTYKRLGMSSEVKLEAEKLSQNYSALYELDNDIRQYRLRKQSEELTLKLDKASAILNSL